MLNEVTHLSRPGFWAAVLILSLSGCASKQAADGSANANTAAAPQTQPSEVSPPPPRTRPVTLPQGATLTIRTTSALSTQASKSGEQFQGSLAQDLLAGNILLAPQGAIVTGTIADSDPGGRVKGRARIGVRLTSVEADTSSGKVAETIRTNTVWREAPGTKKKDAMKVGIGSGVGAALGAIFGGGKGAAIGAGVGAGAGGGVVLATRGDSAVIPAESVLTFALEAPLTVEVNN